MIQIGGWKNLAGGKRFYAYSGIKFGDVSAPSEIQLIDIKSTGLKDTFIRLLPYYGLAASGNPNDPLGIELTIDGITVIKSQAFEYRGAIQDESFSIFVPRQSRLIVNSINTSANNLQERGANILGWYL